jgi:3-oxoacyl-[acyl-carrier protein] reductase
MSILLNRGIGRGIALSLARDGAKVVVNYQKDIKAAQAVVDAINSVKTGSAVAIQGDVSLSTDVDRLFTETKRIFGRIDIVVANSGIGCMGPLATVTNDEFARVFDVNVKGTFYTLRAAANNIENNGTIISISYLLAFFGCLSCILLTCTGRVIVIGSIGRPGTSPGAGVYASSKAATEVLANTLAQELGGKGVTVNTIHPGKRLSQHNLHQ